MTVSTATDIVLPGYRIGPLLGQGGMARVYRGEQLSLGRPVAIKLLDASMAREPLVQQQFQQESRLIARLNHPNIIHVIDQGTINDQPYFVMEYVKAVPLNTVLSRDDVSLTRKLDIAIQICKALSCAHRNGVVHRDIKPGNVLVDYEGHVRVLDFGIAGYFSRQQQGDTSPSIVMGTPAYMAPEQRRASAEITHLSDIYALGVLMHELFLGCKPPAFVSKPAEVPQLLLQTIRRCLQQALADRPQSADEVRQTLLLILQGRHLQPQQWQELQQQPAIPSRYGLLDILRENPFGATYLVNDPQRNQLLIVKKQLLAYASSALEASRQLTGSPHPNIVTLHGTAQNEKIFIAVTDYVSAGSLQDRLTQAHDLDYWLGLAVQVCDALVFAHGRGVVHGNLRPGNVLLTETGQIKVTDFGFRAHSDGQALDWYQPRNERRSPRSDVYSVGALWFHLLTGEVVKPGPAGPDNASALDPLPVALRTIILKALRTDAHERYQHMQEMRDALQGLTSPEVTVARVESASEATRPVRPWLGWLLFAVAVLAMGSQLLYFFGSDLSGSIQRWLGG